MLRGAWRYGIKYELIPRERSYVMDEVTVPARPRGGSEAETVVWTPDQYGRFFDWVIPNRPLSWVAFYFVASSADRESGNLGLRWDDVDLEDSRVYINNFVKYHGKPGKSVLIEPFGKNGAGHQILLDPRTVAVLKAEKARQAARLLVRTDRHPCPTEERNCPLPGYHDRGLVFPQRDGNYRNPNNFLELFKRAIRAYNREHPNDQLPVISVHALRHGWSSAAGNRGVPDTVRMKRLNQSTLAVNRRYTHAEEAALYAAATTVSDAMFADSIELGNLGG
jgi:integrase